MEESGEVDENGRPILRVRPDICWAEHSGNRMYLEGS
jgi:hypothetical protein